MTDNQQLSSVGPAQSDKAIALHRVPRSATLGHQLRWGWVGLRRALGFWLYLGIHPTDKMEVPKKSVAKTPLLDPIAKSLLIASFISFAFALVSYSCANTTDTMDSTTVTGTTVDTQP